MSTSPSLHVRRAMGGTAQVFLAETLLLPTGLLTAAVLARRLGPDQYGLFTLAAVLISWVEWSISSVFSRATVKLVGDAEDWRPTGIALMRLHLVVSVLTMFLLLLMAGPIATMLNEPVLAPYLRLFALDIPLFSLAHAHRNILVGTGSFGERALASAGRWVSRMVFVILLVSLGLSVPGAIIGSMGASLVELIIARFYVRPSFFGRAEFRARNLWSYAAPLFLFAIAMRLYDKVDLVMLKVLGATAAQVGIYGAAQNLTLMPGVFALSFSPILLSILSRVLRGGDMHLARGIAADAMRVVIILLPFAAMVSGAASEIVGVVFGRTFSAAAPLLALLIFGALAVVMISVNTAILTAAGKPGWTFVLAGPLVPLAVVGHLVFIPRFGAIGAALVTTTLAWLGAAATLLAVNHTWQVLPRAATLPRSLLVGAMAFVLAGVWKTSGFWISIKLLAVGAFIIVTFMLLGEFGGGIFRSLITRAALHRRAVPGHDLRRLE